MNPTISISPTTMNPTISISPTTMNPTISISPTTMNPTISISPTTMNPASISPTTIHPTISISPTTTIPTAVLTNSSVTTTTTATMVPSISIQSCPIISNTDYIHNLQLIIYYNDNNPIFYENTMSLYTYSIKMVNAISLSIQQTADISIISAVCDMSICSIFNVDIDKSCTDYEHNDEDIPNRWTYIAFGKFRTNAFKDDVITLMESSSFRYIFGNNMKKLNIEYFESTAIIVFDPTDTDKTSKDTENTNDTDTSRTIIIILIIFVILLILIVIGVVIYCKRSRESHHDLGNKENESLQLTNTNTETNTNTVTNTNTNSDALMGDTEGNKINVKAQHITQASTTQNEATLFIE
eukprot:38486_1